MSTKTGCELCGAKADLKCARCLTTYYCCKQHQKKDWPRHKTICKKGFPAQVLELRVQPPPKDQPCYFRIVGKVKDGRGNTIKVDERYPITAEQLVRFTESPSHACTFADTLTRQDTSFMTKLRAQACAKGFKCYRWADDSSSCEQPIFGLLLHAGCMAMAPPLPPRPSNEFLAQIVMNGCFCRNLDCYRLSVEILAEANRVQKAEEHRKARDRSSREKK